VPRLYDTRNHVGMGHLPEPFGKKRGKERERHKRGEREKKRHGSERSDDESFEYPADQKRGKNRKPVDGA